MKDKDRTIIIVEVAVRGMSVSDMDGTLGSISKWFKRQFDDSIRTIVVPVNRITPDIRVNFLNKKRITTEQLQEVLDRADKILNVLPSLRQRRETEDSPRC